MNTDSLQAFYTTVAQGNISKASKILHLTQPALSMKLQSLEKSVGKILLQRSNQGVTLTRYGEVVYEYAKNILQLIDNMNWGLKELDETIDQKLIIGVCPSIAEYILPCSIYLFKERYPGVQIEQKIQDSHEILNGVSNHTLQIGFIQGHYTSEGMTVRELFSSKLHLVMPANRNYVKGDSIMWDMLAKLPLILPQKGTCTRNMIEQALGGYRIGTEDLQIVLEFDSLEAIKSLVLSGRGMAFLPYMVIKKELYTGKLKSIEIEGADMLWKLSIVHLAEHSIYKMKEAFLRFITSPERGFC